MEISMSAMVAPHGLLRIWLGISTPNPAFNSLPAWSLSGTALQPTKNSRPLSRVNPFPTAKAPFCYTGIYEFQVPDQPEFREFVPVKLQLEQQVRHIAVKRVPASVRSAKNSELKVLLLSCYSRDTDPSGSKLASLIGKNLKPDLIILMGDQVYLDLPNPITTSAGDPAQLLDEFQAKYWRNWSPGSASGNTFQPRYGDVMAVAPWISVPDDHEYWNNAPHWAPLVKASYSENSRNNMLQQGSRCIQMFQLPLQHDHPITPNHPASRAFKVGHAYILDIAPLSFFIADTRSTRQPDYASVMSANVWTQFQQWQQHLDDKQLLGVVVTGQSIIDNPTSWLKKKLFDAAMPDYQDYMQWVKAFNQTLNKGIPLLLLTGDVHYGAIRAFNASNSTGNGRIYEVISSPVSLIPWTKHPKAKDATIHIRNPASSNKLEFHLQQNVQGDHATLLKIQESGAAVNVAVHRYPLGNTWEVLPREQQPFQLKLRRKT